MARLLTGLIIVASLAAQDAVPARSGVKQALAYIEANHDRHVEKQIQISEIPAPTFAEKARGEFMASEFRRVGLKEVSIDPRGNVLGWRHGTSPRAIALAAHLDTVFPAETDVKVRREGKRLVGPGIGDDARGLTTILAIAEALEHGNVKTGKSILFVANCCEEGLGNLLGVKYLLQEGQYKDRIDAFISVDGSSQARIVNGALGSKRYRVTIKGPGGHSYGNFGRANPAHALGRAIAYFSEYQPPAKPKTTFNVGKIGGGTSVNAISFEMWMEVDMRSESEAELDKIEQHLLASIRRAVEDENKVAKFNTKVEAENKILGVRYTGFTPEDSALVRAAQWAAKQMGITASLTIGSTDSNIPINMKMPAVTLGGGGRGDSAHSLEEWYEPEGGWRGIQQVMLTVLAWDELAQTK
ncbi:MAG: M20/M25/M40 family metallo-hydrolase [Bryobacteraceae bacterium]|nr:M20/M25/M40 family metallo-hydrolase [Bryobacteraceae bacterium]